MGKATVKLLASLDAHVAVADVDEERARRVAEAAGGEVEAMPIAVDVLDDRALVDVVGRITGLRPARRDGNRDRYGGMELADRQGTRYLGPRLPSQPALVLRGGAGGGACADRARRTGINRVHRVRRWFALCAVPCVLWRRQGGPIDLVKSMTVEWGRHGIRANVVAPGAMITPRIPHMGNAEAAITGRIQLERRGTVEEIADAIVFLFSDMSRYVTGQTLAVDGGFLAQYPFELSAPVPAPTTTGG